MGNQIVSQELMDMGNRVREYRNKRHWSQEKLAEEADISLNTVSRIEGGQTRMSIEIFKRLVQALGINAEFLLFGEISEREKQDCARIQFFPRATSQADMLACPFGDCRESRILCIRLQELAEGDKEILLQTMGMLAESLQKYR